MKPTHGQPRTKPRSKGTEPLQHAIPRTRKSHPSADGDAASGGPIVRVVRVQIHLRAHCAAQSTETHNGGSESSTVAAGKRRRSAANTGAQHHGDQMQRSAFKPESERELGGDFVRCEQSEPVRSPLHSHRPTALQVPCSSPPQSFGHTTANTNRTRGLRSSA